MVGQNLGYVQIENAVIDSPALRPMEREVYIRLKRHRNRKSRQCFPSVATLAHGLGGSESTIYRARRRLKSIGLIDWNTEVGRKHSCHCRFPLEDGTDAERARVLENLKGNKTCHQRQGLSLSPEIELNLSPERKKPCPQRHPNKKKLTKGNVTNKERPSLSIREKQISMPDYVRKELSLMKARPPLLADREMEEEQKAKLRRQAEELKARVVLETNHTK